MKKIFLLVLSAIAGVAANAQSLYFASRPSLSPDGSEVFFSWSGDIFRVPNQGGLALRMISMSGIETSPLVSPDGKNLAFASNETGNYNVYIVPLSVSNFPIHSYEQPAYHIGRPPNVIFFKNFICWLCLQNSRLVLLHLFLNHFRYV